MRASVIERTRWRHKRTEIIHLVVWSRRSQVISWSETVKGLSGIAGFTFLGTVEDFRREFEPVKENDGWDSAKKERRRKSSD